MKYKLILFVLILLVIKTNVKGQVFYYYKGEKIPLTVNEDKILIRMQDQNDNDAKNQLLNKVKGDPNFQFDKISYYRENRPYYMLNRIQGASINIEDEINYYKNEAYISSVSPMYVETGKVIKGISNEIVVKFKNESDIEQIKSLASKYEYSSLTKDTYNAKIFHIFLSKASSGNVFQVANELYETGLFDIAVPNFFGQLQTSCSTPTPSDPLYNNTTLPTRQWALPDINICQAWDIASGSTSNNVVVAIVDNGVEATHEDLSGRVLTGTDLESSTATNPKTDASQPEMDFHGTSMAGIVAAIPNNGKDFAGVTLNAKIYPVRAFLENSVPCFGCTNLVDFDDSHLSSGINAAASNADVINCSWSLSSGAVASSFPLIDGAIQDAFALGRNDFGCVVVFSAGNFKQTHLDFPATSSSVLAVTASDVNDNFAGTFPINPSQGSNSGTCVGVAAPGANIDILAMMGMFSFPGVLGSFSSGQQVSSFPNVLLHTDGTSESAAYVSGVAALLLQINPCLTAPEVYAIIESTADKTGTMSYSTNAQWGTWNSQMGYGRINAGNAAVLAHDMYRQHLFDVSSYVYRSINDIYAGNHVTSIIPAGNYTAAALSDIHFYARTSINLEPGFEAQYTSTFNAEITNNYCGDNWNTHWKHANTNDNNLNIGQNNPNNYNAQQTLSSFNGTSNAVTIYPNPTSGISYLDYQISATSVIEIKLVNSVGQDLSYLIQPYEKNPTAGSYKVTINSDQLTPGVYYCSISFGGQIVTKKLTVY